jgi:hypothetical protein
MRRHRGQEVALTCAGAALIGQSNRRSRLRPFDGDAPVRRRATRSGHTLLQAHTP